MVFRVTLLYKLLGDYIKKSPLEQEDIEDIINQIGNCIVYYFGKYVESVNDDDKDRITRREKPAEKTGESKKRKRVTKTNAKTSITSSMCVTTENGKKRPSISRPGKAHTFFD